ncbi:MAG: hypothetical protein ACFB0D_05015 [Phormidesmis sp.]
MTDLDNTAAVVADHYLGNISEDKEIAIRLSQAQQQNNCLTVSIERKDCGKGRVFTQTDTGQAVGIVKGRNWRLRDGDVLSTQSEQLVLVNLQKQPVIALQFERKAYNTPVNLLRLGHIIGNRHWPITLRGETLYVEVAANADVVESAIREAMQTMNIKGLHIVREFKSADQVLDFSADASAAHPHIH